MPDTSPRRTAEIRDARPDTDGLTLEVVSPHGRLLDVRVDGELVDLVVERRARAAELDGRASDEGEAVRPPPA